MSWIGSVLAGLPFVGEWFGGVAGGGKSRALYDCCTVLKPTAYKVEFSNELLECDECSPCWFVASESGSDRTGDGSEERPFRTISHALDVIEMRWVKNVRRL